MAARLPSAVGAAPAAHTGDRDFHAPAPRPDPGRRRLHRAAGDWGAQRSLSVVKTPYRDRAGGRRPRRITTSVGVAAFRGGDVTGDEMLVNADLAMYDAKEAGRDRHAVYAPDRHEPPRAQARMQWVERIREALEEDRFVLHAQPILDLRTGAIAQHELLLRMLDAHGDLIPPGAFLQVAGALIAAY